MFNVKIMSCGKLEEENATKLEWPLPLVPFNWVISLKDFKQASL